MLQKHSFWKELPCQLEFANWEDLGQVWTAEGITSVILGSIIGTLLFTVLLLEDFAVKSFDLWLECCLIGIVLFIFVAFLRGFKRIVLLFRFLFRYIFQK